MPRLRGGLTTKETIETNIVSIIDPINIYNVKCVCDTIFFDSFCLNFFIR